jgi:hypothetical protein
VTDAQGTAALDKTPAQGSVVCYRVRAVSAAGESAFSNIARVSR